MSYSYDRRMASDDDDDKEDAEAKALEQLEDLMGMCGDAVQTADSLESELSKRTDSDALRDPFKIAEDIHADLRTAESVEKLSDFVACIKEVKENLVKLEAALKTAKRDAKAGDEPDGVALEAIEEAKDYIKTLKRELRAIEDEMADVQESAKD